MPSLAIGLLVVCVFTAAVSESVGASLSECGPGLDELRALVEHDAEILACGTNLGYHSLRHCVAVGTGSSAYAIAETMLTADRWVNV